MGKKAFVFPGQGSQFAGMGKDVAEAYPEAKSVFDKANEILGFDLTSVCCNGSDDELKQTDVAQPAIFTASAAVFEVFKKREISFEYTAGHSLGEYSAYYAAGLFSFEDGLKLVRKRGELMRDADPQAKGAMASILGLDDEKVSEICERAKKETSLVIVPANFNSKGQVVISGEKDAVLRASEIADEEGANVIQLPVAGAFHSPLMEPAAKALSEYLDENVKINEDISVKVFANVTAKELDTRSAKDILVKQLTSSVLWKTSVMNMISRGVDTFVEIGPRFVLTNLMKRIDKGPARYSTDTPEKIEKLIETLSGE